MENHLVSLVRETIQSVVISARTTLNDKNSCDEILRDY